MQEYDRARSRGGRGSGQNSQPGRGAHRQGVVAAMQWQWQWVRRASNDADGSPPAAAVASCALRTLTHLTLIAHTYTHTTNAHNSTDGPIHNKHTHSTCALQVHPTGHPPVYSTRRNALTFCRIVPCPPQRNPHTTASQHATPRHVSRHVMFARSPIPHHRHQPSARCRRSTIVRPAARGGRGPAETTKGKARRAGGGNAMTMGEGFRSESNISHGDKVSTTRSTVGISPQSRQGGGNAMALAMGEPCLK